jgi:hypothetical protein
MTIYFHEFWRICYLSAFDFGKRNPPVIYLGSFAQRT